MRPLRSLVLAGIACLLLSSCRKDDRPRSAAWTDPKGDVQEFPGEPSWIQPDIVKAEARSQDGQIILSVDMPFSIKDYYLQLSEKGLRRGQLLAVFYLDVDANPATGQNPVGIPDRSGYEYSVPMSLGFWAKSKETGLVHAGRITFDPRTYVYKRVPSFELFRLHSDYQEAVNPGGRVGVKSYDELTTAEGGRMEVRLPYKLLGLDGGASVRLCVHEASAGLNSAALTEDKTLVLE